MNFLPQTNAIADLRLTQLLLFAAISGKFSQFWVA
jgi:hypothetical protein